MAFFAARQPILDINKNVFAYELLFRTSIENAFPDVDQEKATSKMIEGLQLDLGLDRIRNGKLAFINFTEDSILKGYPSLLPNNQIVVEVLEDVSPTETVRCELEKLASKGYIIALDDFIHDMAWEGFYRICHIIKIDIQAISERQLDEIGELRKRYSHIRFLAEKVETHEEFQKYKELGFELFQGYFFSKPEVIKSHSLSPSQSLISTLMKEVNKEVPDFRLISEAFEADVALSFKLLRYTQSPLFARRRKIENIKQAVVMLGERELKKFIMLIFAATFGEGKPTELVRLSLHRAKFCEQLAEQTQFKQHISSAFLVGMLSLIDAMMDADIDELVGKMHLADNIKEALLVNKGWLADFVKLCHQLEKANWNDMEKTCKRFSTDTHAVLQTYLESGVWADERLEAIL